MNDKRGLARTWGGGRGRQCAKLPLPGRELCAQHHAELSSKSVGRTRGLVTDEIPRAKLLEFVRHASRREEKEFAVAVDAERAKQRHAPRRRPAQKLWYVRCHFWREVERFAAGRDEDLRNISDLSPGDRESCLWKTHEHFWMHPALQMRGRGSGFVLPGKGPALDADFDDDRFTYNGSDRVGGRVFQWYRKAVFHDRLREQGWTKRAAELGLLCTFR